MTLEELCVAAGLTTDQLVAILSRSALLVQVESKRAELARKEAERHDAIARYDAELRELASQVAALTEQAHALL